MELFKKKKNFNGNNCIATKKQITFVLINRVNLLKLILIAFIGPTLGLYENSIC